MYCTCHGKTKQDMIIKHYASLIAHCQTLCALFDLDFWASDPKLTGDSLLLGIDVWA